MFTTKFNGTYVSTYNKPRFKKGVGHSPYLFFKSRNSALLYFQQNLISWKIWLCKQYRIFIFKTSIQTYLLVAYEWKDLSWNKRLNSWSRPLNSPDTSLFWYAKLHKTQGFLISKNMFVIFDNSKKRGLEYRRVRLILIAKSFVCFNQISVSA